MKNTLAVVGLLSAVSGVSCDTAESKPVQAARIAVPKPPPSKYAAPRPPSAEALRALVVKIQAILPPGWHVKARGADLVEIVKDQAVEALWGANLPGGRMDDDGYFEKNARFHDYGLLLECRALISTGDYLGMVEEHRKTESYENEWKIDADKVKGDFPEFGPVSDKVSMMEILFFLSALLMPK